jgi:gentisate 1,2-dioxygenase
MTRPTPQDLEKIVELDVLNDSLDPLNFRAGWNKTEASLWPEPRTGFLPNFWSWDEAKAGLDAAGRLISAEKAERRNLFMVNPKEGNTYSTVRTLVTAHQMILPGETARSHRHSPNALRLVLDVPEGAYTTVNGIRVDMKQNDVLLTPGMAWHGHGNEGDRPGYWIDFLDVPLVHLLEPMFLENWNGLQPAESVARPSEFVFNWQDTRANLDLAAWDSAGTRSVELGAPALPTVKLEMLELKPGARPTVKSTCNQIFVGIEGSGTATVDGQQFNWARGDVFCVPSWKTLSHGKSDQGILFRVSDTPVFEKLGFDRHEVE